MSNQYKSIKILKSLSNPKNILDKNNKENKLFSLNLIKNL